MLITHRPVDNWQNIITKTYTEHNKPNEGPGVDFGAQLGAPVYATHDGRVRLSTFQNTGYGEVVVIEAPGETHETTYAHLEKRLVKRDDVVNAGDIIGHVGSTGNSTGAHLHFGLRIAPWQYTEAARWGYSDPTSHLVALLSNVTTINRMGPYVLSDFSAIKNRLKSLQPAWVVLHEGEAKREHVDWLRKNCPHTKIIVRLYESDNWYNDAIRSNPEAAAVVIAGKIRNHECKGLGCYWITSNEVCQDWSGLPFLNRFYLRLQNSTSEKLVLYSTSVENLPWDREDDWQESLMLHWKQLYPSMRHGLDRGDVIGIHQYNASRLLNPGAVDEKTGLNRDDMRIFRYEELVWPNLPDDLKRLPVIVSEWGWDYMLWPYYIKFGVQEPRAADSAGDAAEQVREFFKAWDREYGDVVPVAGWLFYCTGDSGGWSKYRWDTTGGNLQTPLLNEIIDRKIGYKEHTSMPDPEPEPDPEQPEDSTLKIYDALGQEQSADWLEANYGNLEIVHAPTGRAFRLVRIDEVTNGNSACKVRVLKSDGTPAQNYVACHWPGAPKQMDSGCKTQPEKRFVYQKTGGDGYTAFAYGPGSYYWPPDTGAYKYWICSPSLASDMISGLGMLSGTNHHHLDLVFQIVDTQTPEPDPDPELPPTEILASLDALHRKIDTLSRHLGAL